MAQRNFAIYEHLRGVSKQGAQDIHSLLAGDRQQRRSIRPRLLTGIQGLLPRDTRLGQLARFLWRLLRGSTSSATADVPAPVRCRPEAPTEADASIPPECDVLVQVNNFQTGGLENVVLDVSQTLIGAGYKVVLLVLGTAGEGVKRAHERGMAVVIGSPEAKAYRMLIKRLKPRIVLAHYSF